MCQTRTVVEAKKNMSTSTLSRRLNELQCYPDTILAKYFFFSLVPGTLRMKSRLIGIEM